MGFVLSLIYHGVMRSASPSGDESDRSPGTSSADWAGETSRRWAAYAEQLEAMLAPVDTILLSDAAIGAGERVLDIGCGGGVTTRAAAAATGPAGAVSAIDISATLIAEAEAIAPLDGAAEITWIAADASVHPFGHGCVDVAISRFGVMFFDDPRSAFENIGRAVRSGGRLTCAVWQRQDASEFQSLAIDVAVSVAAQHGVTLRPDPPDSGPFAYGSLHHTEPILQASGWTDVAVTPYELPLHVGGPGTTPGQAVAMGRQVGPLATLLRDVPDDVADTIARVLADEMQTRWDGVGVALQAAIAVVTARRP